MIECKTKVEVNECLSHWTKSLHEYSKSKNVNLYLKHCLDISVQMITHKKYCHYDFENNEFKLVKQVSLNSVRLEAAKYIIENQELIHDYLSVLVKKYKWLKRSVHF